jgi:DNA invertase Pin-like site-specific DNA recombinase
MLIGYARTSTIDQVAGLEAQHRDLSALGCERIFTEQVSSVDVKERAQLAAVLQFVRTGDTLIVTKLDRLARSTTHLFEIVAVLKARGAALRILDPAIDTNSATGELILTIFGGLAQFEREIMLERQREGIAKAKADGKYKGRAPTVRKQKETIKEMHKAGVSPTEIARQLKIGRSGVYRMLDA